MKIFSYLFLFFFLGYGYSMEASKSKTLITEHGAVADGQTLNTEAIQKAIDEVAQRGGGTVIVPPGVFLTGTIHLRSHINLHLQSGAVLKGSPNLDDYYWDIDNVIGSDQTGSAVAGILFSVNVENVSITGHGTIDGNGRSYAYHDVVKELPEEIKKYTRQGLDYHDPSLGIQDGPVTPFEGKRPQQMLMFSQPKNLHVENITLKDSPFWAFHIADGEGIVITGIKIRNNMEMANADGINITSSSNVVISNCDIRGGDDALAFSGYSVHHGHPGFRDIRHPSRNVAVSNCLLQTRSSGIRIGGVDQNDLKNYSFNNIIIRDSNRGIGLFVNQDGSLENISFSNITIETRLHTGDWWGNAEPVHISVSQSAEVEKKLGTMKNIRFYNIDAISENGILIYGSEESVISDVIIDGLNLTIRNGKIQETYGGNFDLRPSLDPEKAIFAHDIPAVFMKHVRGVQIRNANITWEDESMHRFFKHTLWAENFHDIRIDNFEGSAPRDNEEMIFLRDGSGFSIRNSWLHTTPENFLKQQNFNGELKMHNNLFQGEF
jgi:hypothetical protein